MEDMRKEIADYKKSLRLSKEHLAGLAKLPRGEQLAELKMLHHFDVILAQNLLRKGATIN